MKKKGVLSALVVFFSILVTRVCYAIPVDAIYTGPSGGSWNDPDNWDVLVVPVNEVSDTYYVTIPEGITVNYDVPGNSQIDTLVLSNGDSRVNFNAGCNLEVLNEADIYGIINADDNNFVAIGTTSALEGCSVRIWGAGGANIELADDTYCSKDIWRSWDNNGDYYGDGAGTWEPVVLQSSGEETLLDFSSFVDFDAAINADGNDFNYQRIIVENGGTLDFSSLQNYFAPLDNRSIVKFELTGTESELRLDSLLSINDSTVSSYYYHGSTYFLLEDALLSLPVLGSVQQTYFGLSSGSSLQLPSISTMDDTQFIVSSGSTVHDGTGASVYSTLNTWRSWDNNGDYYGDGAGTWEPVVLQSSGVGSLLDLSSVQTLNAGFNNSGNDYVYQNIIAENSGTTDLSGLQTIIAPVDPQGRLKISVTGDASLLLDSLTEINGSYSGSYYYFSKVPFILDSVTVSLPSLANSGQASFSLTNSANLQLPSISTMDDTQFIVSSGSTVHDGTGASVYSTLNTWRSWDDNGDYYGDGAGTWEPVVLQSSGVGSLLDLSSVQTLNAGFNNSGNDYVYQNIIAENSGTTDLSGLQTIIAPVDPQGRLKISVTGDASLLLDSLTEINGSYSGSYYYFSKVPFILDSVTVSLPSLANSGQASFSLTNSANLQLPSISTMDDTQFIVSSGSTVHDGTGASVYSTLNTWRSWDDNGDYYGDGAGTWEPVVLQSSGVGSLLDLSSVQTLNAGFDASGNDYIYQKVVADDHGIINLSGVQTLTAPYGSDDKLNFVASVGALIDLSSLNVISTANAGAVNFTLSNSELRFGHVNFGAKSTISLDEGSHIHAAAMSASATAVLTMNHPNDLVEIDGDLRLGNFLAINASGIGKLKIGGVFTFDFTDETQLVLSNARVHLDGSGSEQFIEVGGLDVGTAVTSLSNGNFGFGQMIVGQEAQSTVVRLRDATDNGNHYPTGDQPEALYLFGVDGENGLIINNGSTLILDDINLYVHQDGAWVHINSLFPPNADQFAEIPYGGGVIRKGRLNDYSPEYSPEDVTNLRVDSYDDRIVLNWDHSANTAGDLIGYKVYFNDPPVVTPLDATVNTFEVTGLAPARAYPARVTAVDVDGYESAGVNIMAATLLPNPTGLTVEPFSGYVKLSWNAVTPVELVKQYAIYASTSNFTSVAGMTPRLLVAGDVTAAGLAGLTNGTPYFFAVTAVNLSGNDRKEVVTVSATPVEDITGPDISGVSYNGVPLSVGAVLTRPGLITLTATDPAGVSRVEFFVDGQKFATALSGTSQYSAFWHIDDIADGAYLLEIIAYDTLGQFTKESYNVTVALAPPVAPQITQPTDGLVTSQTQITVAGIATEGNEVIIYRNGSPFGNPVAIPDNGAFSLIMTLVEGNNFIQAAAVNRAGTGPLCPAVHVTLDSNIPPTPGGFIAEAKSEGQILLRWNAVVGATITGYDLYRSTQSFAAIDQAAKVNGQPITTTSYIDLPPADGLYYYRVVSVNNLGIASKPSQEASAQADGTPPRAVSIEYTPSGNSDPVSGRIAPGKVAVLVTVNERLLTIPFLSIAPDGGVPITVSLSMVNDTQYQGSFEITENTPSGTSYAVFSARDLVGNRGTEIDSGQTILIDTDGPKVIAIATVPQDPIRNSETEPAEVQVTIELDESIPEGMTPELSYQLSGHSSQVLPVAGLTRLAARSWQGSFTLPADAGLTEVETLSFAFRAVDDLGNISTTIAANNLFQVYQGDLPPLPIPAGLTAKALPGGFIRLTWQAVDEASDYQLYRQGPGGDMLSQHVRTGGAVEFVDDTPEDGLYHYAVASVRSANGQEAVSGQSNAVEVTADSIAPDAPDNLELQLVSAGIQAAWAPPAGETSLTFALYRSSAEISVTTGLTPVVSGTGTPVALDPAPSESQHYYAVTAFDAAGNESLPSASAFIDFDLLPVATLTVIKQNDDLPVVSWTHNNATISGFNFYLGRNDDFELIEEIPATETSYIDTGYTGDERRYAVSAVDSEGVESLRRMVVLPMLDAVLMSTEPLQRGLMNILEYKVTNHGISSDETDTSVQGIRLKVTVDGHEHLSPEFSLEPDESKSIPLVVGGYDDLPDLSPLTTAIEITRETGEKAMIVRTGEIEVFDGSLVAGILTEGFTRGVSGTIRFTLENTGDADIEIITATGYGGSPSNEISFKLLDSDENVLATAPFKQVLGEGVFNLADGVTVARIAPGAIFTSDPVIIPVPLAAPDYVTIKLDIANIHYNVGKEDHISLQGISSRQPVVLKDVAYSGAITSITPEHSAGDEPIIILGQAIVKADGLPLSYVPLKLIIRVMGFERLYNLYTDSEGAFSFSFVPLANESGYYTVSCIHPDLFERPIQGEFTIGRVIVSPTRVTLKIPRDYQQVIPIQATAGPGTTATNVHLEYNAADQPLGSLPAGIHLTLGDAVSLVAGQTAELPITVLGDAEAAASGTFVVAVKSNETGSDSLAMVQVDYELYDAAAAQPSLAVSPSSIETGVTRDSSVTETFTVENKGLAEAQNVKLELLMPDGSPAPAWIFLSSPDSLGNMAVGDKQTVDIVAVPSSTVAEAIHQFKLQVAADNHPTVERGIFVTVTTSDMGNFLFHVSDIYTATLDANGTPIPGLSGARIRVQNQQVLSVEQTLYTDNAGEALFSDLPAGLYAFRASAADHKDQVGYLWIKPGITVSREVFLDNNLITVEWSVTEITIEDRYEITLTATYETDVPAAVVVVEPMSVNLPDMQPGDVYYGEFTLTNYGLIRADNLQVTPPALSRYFKFELMNGLPDSLDAKERVTAAYRVTGLAPLDELTDGSSDGGATGCTTETMCTFVGYDFECANNVVRHSVVNHCVIAFLGECDPAENDPPSFTVPPPPSTGSGTSVITVDAPTPAVVDVDGGSGTVYSPIDSSIGICPPNCPGECCGDPGGGNGTGSGDSVNPACNDC